MQRLLLIALAAVLAAPAAAHAAEVRVTNTLVFTRTDGSLVEYPFAVRVWCGHWEPHVPVRTLHLRIGWSRPTSHWSLSAVVADVRRRPVVRLPRMFVWNAPKGALLFATDGQNELSSAEEEASGRIRFDRVRCGRHLAVRFRIRAVLGSEFLDGEPLSVRGRFHARAENVGLQDRPPEP
jgi:hypothetical protein